MSSVEVYRGCRERLFALAGRLTGPQRRSPVPACPGWTVKDVYAHLAGGAVDVVRKNLEGAGTPKWTAAHVEARRAASLEEIIEEWQTHAGLMEKELERQGKKLSALTSDIWCHEYDITGALGWRGSREPDRVEWGARSIRAIPRLLEGTDLPVPTVIADGETILEGDGPILRAPAYELARMLYGRRSYAQIRAMDWDRNPTRYLKHLSFFPAPKEDLVD